MHTCIDTNTLAHKHTHTHAHMHRHKHKYKHPRQHVHDHMHMHIHVHMHVNIRISTQTHTDENGVPENVGISQCSTKKKGGKKKKMSHKLTAHRQMKIVCSTEAQWISKTSARCSAQNIYIYIYNDHLTDR